MKEGNEIGHSTSKLIRKSIICIIVMAFMFPLLAAEASAQTPVTIDADDPVKGGEVFTVKVTFGNGSVGRVDAQMLYDPDILTYLSGGSSSGNTGYIQLKDAGTEGSVTFSLEFQAVAEGETTLEVITNEMYDLDEMYLDNPSAARTIAISGNAQENELITEEADKESEEVMEIQGVDEKPVGETEGDDVLEDSPGSNMVLIIVAAVLIILIIIISVVLAAKRRR